MQQSINIGGQAVLEGVMMRAPRSMTVAVRTPSGEIALRKDALKLLADRWKFLKWPVLRGTVTLFSALALGMKALNFSATCAMEELAPKSVGQEKPKGMSDFAMGATMVLSIVLGLGLFFYLPLYLTQLMKGILPVTVESSLAFNLVDGVIRITVFLLYILVISRMKDIRRVFEYHGAEHKAIYAYEAGGEITVETARPYTTLHPRCGTSFLLIVMVLSILVFSFIPRSAAFYEKALARLFLIPVIAGLSYEFIRFSAKRKDSPVMSALIAPGLWLQKLTTREPSDDQLEVAIHALKEALAMEEESGSTAVEAREVATCLGS
jgi:uncharacterized protein YqhQ